MSRKLFIIGNGLDLNLKMKTSYDDLKNLIKHKDMKLFRYINEQVFDGDESLWSSFEENVMTEEHNLKNMIFGLKNMQNDIVETADTGGDPSQGDVLIQMENNDQQIVSEIQEQTKENLQKKIEEFNEIFDIIQEYLINLLNKAEKKSRIPNHEFKSQIEENSIFLNFNYTHSLENVYKIKKENIKYVHGELNRNDLLLGNSENNIKLIEENALNLDDPERQYFDKSVSEYSKAHKGNITLPEPSIYHDWTAHPAPYSVNAEEQANEYNIARRKWIKEIQVEKVQEFLFNFKDIEHIIIAGHSLGKVDLPYFNLLQKLYPNATLTIFVHNTQKINDKILDNIGNVFPYKKYKKIKW